jgi:hypothetical protein
MKPTKGAIAATILTGLFLISLLPVSAQAAECAFPLSQVKEAMSSASIAAYSGSCPCPYYRDRAGRRCGKRSAWSKPGGAEPLCFLDDISDAKAQQFCKRLGG